MGGRKDAFSPELLQSNKEVYRMSHGYDDEMKRPTERRSRRNQNQRGTGGRRIPSGAERQTEGLNVMNGSSLRSSPRSASRRGAAQTAATSVGVGKRSGGSMPRRARDNTRKRTRRRIITMIVAECFALVFIFGYAYVSRLLNKVNRPEINMEEVQNQDLDVVTREKLKGYWTIAVFGVDARDKAINSGTNSDVNIICNINLETGEIKLVSLFRDTYLNISKEGSYNKFNQAYFVGGPEQAMSAMNRNLDLNISDYITFNWKAVADAINILGGVDIELSNAEFYYINSFITETVKVTGIGSQHLSHAGMNHLDGVQAVAYGRLRLMDTDFARTERQRKVIKQTFEKAKQADFETLNRVLGTVFPQISTSLWVDDIYVSLKNINKYHLGDSMGFPAARGDVNIPKKGACVIPQTLETNVVKLHEFLFDTEEYTPSEAVKNISQKIAADTGMYKEGTYVKSVDTDGGVIQPPKATKAAAQESTRKAEEATKASVSDDKEYEDIYVLDADGKKVKKTIVRETDSDGDYVKQETNADGIAVNWEINEEGKLVRKRGGTTSPTSTSESETAVWPGGRESGGQLNPDESSSPYGPTTAPENPGTLSPQRPGGHPTDSSGSPQQSRPSAPTESESASRNSLVGPSGSGTLTESETPSQNAPVSVPNTSPASPISPGGPGQGTTPLPGGTGGPPNGAGSTGPTSQEPGGFIAAPGQP